jgi:glutamate N-acetyltransferase/amino-acid N-acetyltransferase
VNIAPEYIKRALSDVIKRTLNMVSVDGDTSTNDMCCIMANGMAGNKEITSESEDFAKFTDALFVILLNLSRMMARDGEGATKLIECKVSGADTDKTAEIVAKSVITSSLFKAAMFGEDANWGRILCAVGYADADFDINKVSVDIASEKGSVAVCRNGAGVEFSEEKAKEILGEEVIEIIVSIGEGSGSATAWGCDLTHEYVSINADYRS